ncbi:MAG: hypothetical protein V4538_16530 [Bacteroidota bacterium]
MEAFTEKQSFIKSWWPLSIAFFIMAAIVPLLNYNNGQLSVPDMMFPVFVLLSSGIFVFFFTLSSRVDETAVFVKFGLFQRSYKVFKWEDIKTVEVRKYNPIMEYGGWGYKGLWKKNRAYSVSGNMGLQITFHNNSKVLIGTKEPDKMKTYLSYLKEKYQIAALGAIN